MHEVRSIPPAHTLTKTSLIMLSEYYVSLIVDKWYRIGSAQQWLRQTGVVSSACSVQLIAVARDTPRPNRVPSTRHVRAEWNLTNRCRIIPHAPEPCSMHIMHMRYRPSFMRGEEEEHIGGRGGFRSVSFRPKLNRYDCSRTAPPPPHDAIILKVTKLVS